MKGSRFGPIAFVAVVASWLALAGVTVGAQTADQSDPQSLIRLEGSWNEAFYRKDVAFLDRVLADEFIATYEDGSRGDKAKEISLTKEFNQQVDSAKQDDFVVKIYGDTAVVWFTQRLVGPSQGRRLALTLRNLDVFVLRAGRWQCVATQSTKITE